MQCEIGVLGSKVSGKAAARRLGADDQAEGLRRMLVCNQPQIITLVSGKRGAGRTSVTLNLATALCSAGRDVLILDENPAPHNLTDSVGLLARHDLLDVIQGRCQLVDAIVTAHGCAILPMARLMRALPRLTVPEQQRLEDILREAGNGVDVMLIDAAMLEQEAVMSSSLAFGVRMLVVMDATSSGITQSYALIKRLALEHARLHFEIVVNKVADEKTARIVFGNIEKVARANLAARLEYLGCILKDDRMKRSTQLGRAVVEAYPSAVSARSCLALSQSVLNMTVQQYGLQGDIARMMRTLIGQHKRQLA